MGLIEEETSFFKKIYSELLGVDTEVKKPTPTL